MVRFDDAHARELEAVATAVGIPASTLAHAAVVGMLRGFRVHGRVTLPLQMIPAPAEATLNEPSPPRRRP